MTRPKGSLDKRRPVPKLKVKAPPRAKTMETIKDLRKMAKDKGVKLCRTMRYADIRAAVGLEPKEYPSRYNHCRQGKPAQTMVSINVDTGEETRYGSIYKLANHLGKFAGSVTYSMKVGRPIVKDGISYTFRRVSEE